MSKQWPIVLAVALLAVASAVTLHSYWRVNPGAPLVYALDDPYIHAAIAKNVVQHGVFGVTPHEFSASSSGPVWTLLLAGIYRVTGTLDVVLLPLNLAIAALLLVWVSRTAREAGFRRGTEFLLLVGVLLLAPLVPVAFTGMEHLFHALVAFGFLWRSTAHLAGAGPPGRDPLVLVLAVLLTGLRYEGLFLLAPVTALLALRGRWKESLLLAIAGLLPVGLFGAYSVSQGSAFLPNSLLLKGSIPGAQDLSAVFDFLTRGVLTIGRVTHLFTLVAAAATLLALIGSRHGLRGREATLLLLFLATAVLHGQFAAVGSFERYEMYLMVMGIPAVAFAARAGLAPDSPAPARPAGSVAGLVILLVVLGFGPAWRGVRTLGKTPRAMSNIYQQQYQMSRFLTQHFPGESVAANDVGLINYAVDLRLLDLFGIATYPVARAKRNGRYTTEVIRRLAAERGVSIALLYESWFEKPGLPPEWVKVAQWTIPKNYVCFSPTVSFFAVEPDQAPRLREALESYGSRLPEVVRVEWAEPDSAAAEARPASVHRGEGEERSGGV